MEETAGEVSPTEDHRMILTRQEEYQKGHRPYPMPLTNSSASHHKYSREIGRR